MDDGDSAAREDLAQRTLRRYTEGVIAFDDRRAPVRFVLDRTTGHVIMPVESAVIEAVEHVLHLPGETAGVMQVLLVMGLLDRPESHEGPDRWMAYHGRGASPGGRWASASIEAGKTETLIFCSEELSAPNTLRPCEAALVRLLNTRRGEVGAACERLRGVEVAEPLAVGVDPLGIDVRARFGVLRLEFAARADDEASARASIERVLRGGAGDAQ